jgi:hypothetical protein
MLLITRLYIRFWKRRHRPLRIVQSRPAVGRIFLYQEQILPSSEAQDTETARRLWEISERQCAVSGRSAEARS